MLHGGRIQQVDTPRALYERPANLFVAAFIGSPAMNLFRGRLAAEGNDLLACFGNHRLPLAANDLAIVRRPRAPAWGATWPSGSGPRRSRTPRSSPPPRQSAVLEARVDLVESLGSELVVHVDLDAPIVELDLPLGNDEETVARPAAGAVVRLSPRSRVAPATR